ncbi:MAG: tRNA glutamyl-Q(34) synthetase GluQRS [Pseudomonadota bacterium]|nr:tRNA glutamyl-Q(34) synthetase GluQRS [Pseudomonadota bacterium]MDP1906067.1 tRNA glutamyl-Q(34) synthetase GluQRS [Pseudomonadota bacterium]MDP2353143.1 tRNA glutamyl-Q(34) synthetase GluQRS [Pseudomonadota bacterium]
MRNRSELSYRGRFAPTPSGPLHFGSLVAALASFLEARSHGGEWLLRIEDVDPPREAKGASVGIQRTLLAHGFEWDGEVVYQSRRGEAYQSALERLIGAGDVYACACSRKRVSELALPGIDGPVYPGSCRGRDAQATGALRLFLPARRVVFHDAWLGRVACDIERECGDLTLKRADGVFTYQLAVVVDDAEQEITHVVRGADLLTSTPRQIVLQQALGYPTPAYLHLPVVLDARGFKLSKQTLAAALVDAEPLPALRLAGLFLGLPEIAVGGDPQAWLRTATRLWPEVGTQPLRGRKQARTSACR